MSKDTFDAFVESASTASKSAEEISARVAAYTQQSWETGVETAKKVAAAKTFHEYVELQTEAARDAMNTYVGQLTDLTELCASAFKDSFTPINKRMTAATQAFRV